jgi:hypothetical protein
MILWLELHSRSTHFNWFSQSAVQQVHYQSLQNNRISKISISLGIWFGTRRSKVQILSPRPLSLTAGCQGVAVRAERDAYHRVGVASEIETCPTCLTVVKRLEQGCQILGRICLVSRSAGFGRVRGYSRGSTRVAPPKRNRFFGKFGARLERLTGDYVRLPR